MGKEIDFYMTMKDRDEFLAMVQAEGTTMLVLRDSDASEISRADEAQIASGKTLVLWNSALVSNLERKWIPESGHFRVDTLHEPVLEYNPSFSATWKGEAAIVQGRLFGNFEPYLGKPEGFGKWYESLTRWIRKNYRKNTGLAGGYVGIEAQQLVDAGAYLLPNFVPPETAEWEAELGDKRNSVAIKKKSL